VVIVGLSAGRGSNEAPLGRELNNRRLSMELNMLLYQSKAQIKIQSVDNIILK